MKHRAQSRFWRCYRELPKEIQDLADRSYALLLKDSSYPSLHFKRVGSFWSSRVGLHYRALALEAEQDLVWFWIGSHADYDKLVGRKPANPDQPSPSQVRRSSPSGRARKPKRDR